MKDEVLATVRPSAIRRWSAVAMLIGLAGILVYVAFAAPPASLGLQFFLLLMGIGAVVMADRIRRATETHIELTAAGLRDGRGRVLCDMDNIDRVERGAFAFKPSNGFAVLLKHRAPRAWAPGLWWRVGRRLGVGGVTPAGQGKFMADVIALHLRGDGGLLTANRDAD